MFEDPSMMALAPIREIRRGSIVSPVISDIDSHPLKLVVQGL